MTRLCLKTPDLADIIIEDLEVFDGKNGEPVESAAESVATQRSNEQEWLVSQA